MSQVLLTSTVMVQDGSRRLVHLIRTDDGLYTLTADRVQVGPFSYPPFSVDVTQAVLWAAQFEAKHNTANWSMILGRLQADGQPLPSHLRDDDENSIQMRLDVARIKARQEELWEELRRTRENLPPSGADGADGSAEGTD